MKYLKNAWGRFQNFLLILSQMANAVIFGGNPDQAVSSRCYTDRDIRGWKIGRKVINGIFFWEDDHCKLSWERDLANAQSVVTLGEFPDWRP